jgi:cytochrome c
MTAHYALAAAALALCVGAALPAHAADAELVARGHAIVENKCARCHAVGPAGESKHPQAPPFRTLHRKYDVTLLAEAFAEGIVTGHPDMPAFTFSPPEIGALIAYIKSLDTF